MAGFFENLLGSTVIGRRMQQYQQQNVQNDRTNNAFSALINQYGPEAGAPQETAVLGSNARAQAGEDRTASADLRGRQVGAQRAGLSILRGLVDLPQDQQAAAMEHYGPALGQAFGVPQDQVFSSAHALLSSPDPHGAIDAFDQSLEPQSEREARVQQSAEADKSAAADERALEVARIGAGSRIDVANLRGGGGAHAMTPQAQALVNTTRSRTIQNALQQIAIARNAVQNGASFANDTPLSMAARTALVAGGGSTAEGQYHTAVQALGGINIANELQALAAAGVHPGRQASTLTEREGQALANLNVNQSHEQITHSLDQLEAMYRALDADLGSQLTAGSTPAPAASTPAPAAAPAAAPGASDDLANFLGRH